MCKNLKIRCCSVKSKSQDTFAPVIVFMVSQYLMQIKVSPNSDYSAAAPEAVW